MSKHTPGPWAVEDDIFVYTHDGRCIVGAPGVNLTEDEAAANASLIAAAPDLLQVLKRFVADAADYPAWQRPCAVVEEAEATIAKAEGRS